MFVSRFAASVLTALSLVALGSGGCNRSSSPDQKASTDESAAHGAAGQDGDDGESAAGEGKPSKQPQPHGPYYPTIVLKTSLGDLTIKLDPQAAPRTVNNFLTYVENGSYNQTIFHQVDKGYIALGGTYTADLAERQGRYPIPNEADNGRKNLRGTVAMARDSDDIDSSTCQFFINLSDNPHLDHKGDSPQDYGYCVFGEVVEGLEVLEKISAVEVEDRDNFEKLPIETVLIESAYRLR
ncbi:MAG TPA: peptidylprolyl isomerase [Pirellulales bacterium]|jgi:cyclophilin family peptidyl-prolyl cis-trans isomerase|nr:peptidylprolyl isomerase [Pirellulales bacterium]